MSVSSYQRHIRSILQGTTRHRIVSPRGTTQIIHNVSPSRCLMVNTHLLLANEPVWPK